MLFHVMIFSLALSLSRSVADVLAVTVCLPFLPLAVDVYTRSSLINYVVDLSCRFSPLTFIVSSAVEKKRFLSSSLEVFIVSRESQGESISWEGDDQEKCSSRVLGLLGWPCALKRIDEREIQ